MLRREGERGVLVSALREIDRLILLGDVVELRHGPLRAALAAAEPVLRELGAALGPGREVVIVPGNHDHGLLRGWLERRDPARELGLETPVEADPREALGALAAALSPARTRVSYPGVWLRDDVYAIHGHYCDRHNTVPIVERLGAGLNVRLTGEPEGGPARAEDYEAALAPMYAWIDTVAQMGGLRGSGGDGSFQIKAWRALGGGGSGARGGGRARGDGPRGPGAARGGLVRRGMLVAFPAVVAGLNRLGIGPLRADVSVPTLRRAALQAFTEVLSRLDVPAAHVIFGHTHRAGPLPGDDPAEWGRLLNTGSWVYEPGYLGDAPAQSPYRPGFAAIVSDDGPPELVNLLDGDA